MPIPPRPSSAGDTATVDRRDFLRRTAAAGLAVAATTLPDVAHAAAPDAAPRSRVPAPDERTVSELQALLSRGDLTSAQLVEQAFARMDALDRTGPALRAVIERNPDALAIAERLDAERKAGRVRGPLHGIPILVKDNLDTGDRMMTSAGSYLLADAPAPRDAFLVERLRAAGAVLIAKANLSEWANFRSRPSTSGWSARGGQVRNPYVLDRTPCGSSSGTGAAIAAGYAPLGVGTETDGSILCPSAHNQLVGLKPTVGLWSRSGIVPISASQDTAGPMCRTVTDAALLLGALCGVDPRDAATAGSAGKARTDYAQGLSPDALRGVRLGVVRNLAGFHGATDARFDDALAALRGLGAELVDVKLETAGKFDEAEYEVLLYEFKDGLAKYLATRGDTVRIRTLADAIAANRADARELAVYGQELFEAAEAKGPITDAAYRTARETCVRLAAREGIDAALATHRVSALVHPTNGPAWLIDPVHGDRYTGGDTSFAAVAGYPSITVPMGDVRGLPVGLTITAGPWQEHALLRYAFAFEQATRHRRPPEFRPTIPA
jgi:amidase